MVCNRREKKLKSLSILKEVRRKSRRWQDDWKEEEEDEEEEGDQKEEDDEDEESQSQLTEEKEEERTEEKEMKGIEGRGNNVSGAGAAAVAEISIERGNESLNEKEGRSTGDGMKGRLSLINKHSHYHNHQATHQVTKTTDITIDETHAKKIKQIEEEFMIKFEKLFSFLLLL